MSNLKELPKKRGRKPLAKELKKEQSGLLKLNKPQKDILVAIASGRGLTVSKMIELDYNLNAKTQD